jgi:acetamidase/formamidase
VHVATGTQVTIKIGANATFQQQGVHWISNPSSGGVYTIAVGGTFGGSGNMLVQVGIKASSVKMVQVQSGLTGPITVNATGAGNLLVVGITAVQISRSGVAEVVEMGASSRFG